MILGIFIGSTATFILLIIWLRFLKAPDTTFQERLLDFHKAANKLLIERNEIDKLIHDTLLRIAEK